MMRPSECMWPARSSRQTCWNAVKTVEHQFDTARVQAGSTSESVIVLESHLWYSADVMGA
jgi:hypothetical protein